MLNYIGCRLKKLTLGVAYKLGLTNNMMSDMNLVGQILDLDPGEILADGKLNKYSCFRVTSGNIIVKGGCLIHRLGATTYNVTGSGELTLDGICTTVLRLNRTHLLKARSDETIELQNYPLPSLLEEETVLKYPPKVISSFDYINELVLNASALNIRRNNGVDASKSVSDVASSPGLGFWGTILAFLSSKALSTFIFVLIGCCLILGLCYLSFFFYKRFTRKDEHPPTTSLNNASTRDPIVDEPLPKRDTKTSKFFQSDKL